MTYQAKLGVCAAILLGGSAHADVFQTVNETLAPGPRLRRNRHESRRDSIA